ncbi:MAG: TIR domain-containing protein, partial [Anaerolineae bacterium]|nr:TIR domain-containing protein [Anaerolineae bacterium]
ASPDRTVVPTTTKIATAVPPPTATGLTAAKTTLPTTISSPIPSSTEAVAADEPTSTPTGISAVNAVQQTATALAVLFQGTLTPGTATGVTGGPVSPSEPDIATVVAFRVQGTAAAYSATEASQLSPAEAGQMMVLAVNANNQIFVIGLLAAMALGASIAALVFAWLGGANRRSTPRTAHPAAHPNPLTAHPQTALPEKMLEDYHIFTSSSDKDKEWVQMLVQDLEVLGYAVWWYAKDAPGLPFGNEIRTAIYHTKVFLIIVSPDSMQSKHVEEEIRWAEIYDRPIVPVVCRPTTIEERLYGLAKGADIDFSVDYKAALEFLTQAIDHYLQQRLEKMLVLSSEDQPPMAPLDL